MTPEGITHTLTSTVSCHWIANGKRLMTTLFSTATLIHQSSYVQNIDSFCTGLLCYEYATEECCGDRCMYDTWASKYCIWSCSPLQNSGETFCHTCSNQLPLSTINIWFMLTGSPRMLSESLPIWCFFVLLIPWHCNLRLTLSSNVISQG